MADNSPQPAFPATRREFFHRSASALGLLAFSRFAPAFLVDSTLAGAPAPERDRRILVVVQLAGGNDGLNTLVPFEDPDYYRLRPTLGIPKDKVLATGGLFGFHPACAELHRLFQDGRLAVVHGVGYPNPNRSHFRSTEIWETASGSGESYPTGWVGRYLDNSCAGSPGQDRDPVAVHANTLNGEPLSLVGAQSHPTFGLSPYSGLGGREAEESRRLLESIAGAAGRPGREADFLKQTLMDTLVTESRVQAILKAYRPHAVYPGNPFAQSLNAVAALIASGMPTRVYFVTLNGFDTHANQLPKHANLLRVLSEGLATFQGDLESHGLDRQVLTMSFSEFGRRASENESRGTDHGPASPLFLLGSRVRGGLHGAPPSLKIPKNQDVAFTTDFRSLYTTMLEDWLECPAGGVIAGSFPKLPLVT